MPPTRLPSPFPGPRGRRGAPAAALLLLLGLTGPASPAVAATPPPAAVRTMADVLAAATAADWRPLDPARTLYLDLDLDRGRVVIELAPGFAPEHVANILRLVRAGYYDGVPIARIQDNFVVQWGGAGRALPAGVRERLPPEFEVAAGHGLPFTRLPDPDGYAPETGFSDGLPAGRDPSTGATWLTHCYGMLGAGRDNAVDSGNGAELYVVIGHAPRQLDRNIALVGRVVLGMELLAALPRGPAPMGFLERPEEGTPIRRVRVAADLPAAERVPLEVLGTDTATFAALVEARRNRRDAWYQRPAGHVDLCNVPVPVRVP